LPSAREGCEGDQNSEEASLGRITVWAPAAKRVDLVRGGERRPLRGTGGGHWQLDGETLAAGTDYAFSLDGGPPLPDPRSPWQPQGVHGPSRAVDHAAFPWTDRGWAPPALATGVVYELHVGTFSPEGTFDGVIGRLDHLASLGVTHVELMPVADFPGHRGWGYDGVALYAPKHGYGGPEGLKRLVDACHARGLAVLLDVVYNHLGPSGNYLAQFGPYFGAARSTAWGPAVNLDGPGSDEVRRFLVDNALMWLRDYHLDGLRLDAVHALLDDSAVHVLEQLATEVDALEKELGRALVLVAESDRNDPRLVRPREMGGFGLDATWSDDYHHALHAVLTGERDGYYEDFGTLRDLAKALEDVYVYDGRYSAYRGRRHGRPVGSLDRTRFLAYAQNHDQVGNRARGDRLSCLLGVPALQAAATLTLLSPFVPMLFQGEEWGTRRPFAYFTDHDEPHLQHAVREGRRREFAAFGWPADDVPDPQDPETFEASRLDWSETSREPHRLLLAWHRQLLKLRRSLDRRGGEPVRVKVDEERRLLVMERGLLTVVVNLGTEVKDVALEPSRPRSILLASAPPDVSGAGVALAPGVVVMGPEAGLGIREVNRLPA
jgi:maltooligosyltrehalose trehalohydrolase